MTPRLGVPHGYSDARDQVLVELIKLCAKYLL
jgi:hypothetical protein